MAIVTRATAVLGMAGVLLAPALAAAQTQAVFDACNQQALAKAASPSASPITGGSMTSPGSIDANRQPNASGRMSVSAGSPGTAAGTMSGGISSPFSGSARGSAAGTDAQLRGMAPAGVRDDAYGQAYRDCMKGRGF